MKTKEKFLLIFFVIVIIVSLVNVTSSYIEFNKVSNEQAKFWGKFESSNNGEEDNTLNTDLTYINVQYLLKYAELNGNITTSISLLFYSLSISFFIYCILMIKYKDKKQYILDNIGVLLVLLILVVINNYILTYGKIFSTTCVTALIAYVVFLVSNIMKNVIEKNKLKKDSK